MTPRILKLARRFKTPKPLQRYIRKMNYNRELKGKALRSADAALREKMAHCLEGALIAAAVLEHHGYPPLVMSLESQDGLDHVIFVFKEKGRWGSIARSRDDGLHGRPPVYRSLRDLAWSYFDPYVDKSGRITAYGLAHLDESGTDWRASKKNLWKLEQYLIDLKHRPLRSSNKRYKRLLKNYLAHGPIPRRHGWW